jgi:probable O-glycosylation ligase (exosortase A-associated)
MAFRDVFLFVVLAVLVVQIPRKPFVGAIAWVIFGVMSPHRLTWGYAFDFPFSQIIAILTLVGLLLTKEHRHWKGGAAAIVMILLFLWGCVNTLFAFHLADSLEYLERVAKIFAMTFVLLLLTHDRRKVEVLVWAIALSLGFYGTKGGLFVLATGGEFMVNGPPGSVMDGNNALGVGLVIVIPLLYFLREQVSSKWVRWGLMAAMSLCAIAVLGSYSRGALLAIFAMGVILWVRSHHKVMFLVIGIVFLIVAIPAMPDRWTNRMYTIETYEEDGSAMGRIWAWQTAFNIAKDRVPFGGGFEWNGYDTSARYSPNPSNIAVAHSIYFQVLGSMGFLGLALFLTFWGLVWRQCSWLRKYGKQRQEFEWAFKLGSMVQVSLVGYAVGGAFLDLAFWDLPYYLFAAVAAAQFAVQREWRPAAASAGTPIGARPRDSLSAQQRLSSL